MVINKLIEKVKYYFTASPLSFLIRFVLSFLVLYLTGKVLIGIAAPGGKLYIPFFDQTFNPIQQYTNALRNGTLQILKIFKVEGYAYNSSSIKTSMVTINIGYSCLGIGIISFWQAFVTAHQQKLQQLIKWALLGTFILYLLNVIRISMLIIGTHLHFIRWTKFDIENHHLIYNIITYVLVTIACVFFNKKYKAIS